MSPETPNLPHKPTHLTVYDFKKFMAFKYIVINSHRVKLLRPLARLHIDVFQGAETIFN